MPRKTLTEEERKQLRRERDKRYRENSPEKCKAKQKRWKAKNREKVNAIQKKYLDNLPQERKHAMHVTAQKQISKNLTDTYIKRLLTQHCGLKLGDITQEMVEAKRATITLYRLLREEED